MIQSKKKVPGDDQGSKRLAKEVHATDSRSTSSSEDEEEDQSRSEEELMEKRSSEEEKTKPKFPLYVFLDLEASGSSIPDFDLKLKEEGSTFWEYFDKLANSTNPEVLMAHFNFWKKNHVKRWDPRIGDIAFLAVPGEKLKELIALDKKKIENEVKNLSVYESKIINMQLTMEKRKASLDEKNKGGPYQFSTAIYNKYENFKEKKIFTESWKELKEWFQTLQEHFKQICIVAHGGFFHDFPVLYCELKRTNGKFPNDQIFYADTMLGIRHLNWDGLDGIPMKKVGSTKCFLALHKLHWLIFYGGKGTLENYVLCKEFHHAYPDCKANLEVMCKFGGQLLQYIDTVAVQLDFSLTSYKKENLLNSHWTKAKMLNSWNAEFDTRPQASVVPPPVAEQPGREQNKSRDEVNDGLSNQFNAAMSAGSSSASTSTARR